MFCDYRSVDTASHIEFRGQPHKSRLTTGHQISEYFVGDRFVKSTLITKRPDVELEGLKLDTERLRYVLQVQNGKIGLPGFGAEAGELRNADSDGIIPLRLRISKRFQRFTRLGSHAAKDTERFV